MSERVPLQGSERVPMVTARLAGAWDPDAVLTVTVHLKPQAKLKREARGQIAVLTPEQLAAARAPSQSSVDTVVDFAHEHGLDVVEVRPAARIVRVTGTVSQLNAAFGVTLEKHESARGVYRGRRGAITLPSEVAKVTSAVTGLDDRPVARPLFRKSAAHPRRGDQAFLPTELRALYGFPSDSQATGAGQTVAIIELVGPKSSPDGDLRCGYRRQDILAYFREQLKLAKTPKLRSVSVDGARNSPTGNPDSADGEVSLDIEVVGGVAPGVTILVYFAPNTDDGFLNAIKRATHDAKEPPCAISISWGGPEASWTEQSLSEYDEAFQDAAALGISVLAAAGDDGASDGIADGRLHVDFPASSPHVTACGGTHLTRRSDTISESVWQTNGATGGGVSDFFALPDYQTQVQIASANPGHHVGRVVPDVSADADPATGYRVAVNGELMTIGGTSAVAPLYAGLVALLVELKKKRLGLLNPLLYELGEKSPVFRDVTSGSNQGYSAGHGYDACTGLGSIKGNELAKHL